MQSDNPSTVFDDPPPLTQGRLFWGAETAPSRAPEGITQGSLRGGYDVITEREVYDV